MIKGYPADMGQHSVALAAALLGLSVSVQGLAKDRPGDPPIVKRKDALTGTKYREQVFEGGPLVLTPDRLSIAQSYYMFDGQNELAAEQVELTCSIGPNGIILDFSCGPDGMIQVPPLLAAARSMGAFSAARVFPAIPEQTVPLRRKVHFSFRAAAVTLPRFELGAGTLVKVELVDGFTPRIENAYPMRALREEAEGVQIFDCHVQDDYSLICHTVQFEPEANFPYFAEVNRRLFSRIKVAPHLKDGSPAKRTHFYFKLRWTIPHD